MKYIILIISIFLLLPQFAKATTILDSTVYETFDTVNTYIFQQRYVQPIGFNSIGKISFACNNSSSNFNLTLKIGNTCNSQDLHYQTFEISQCNGGLKELVLNNPVNVNSGAGIYVIFQSNQSLTIPYTLQGDGYFFGGLSYPYLNCVGSQGFRSFKLKFEDATIISVCGDTIVNGVEVCDEGTLNGLEGHCNDTCSGTIPLSNATIKKVENNNFFKGFTQIFMLPMSLIFLFLITLKYLKKV